MKFDCPNPIRSLLVCLLICLCACSTSETVENQGKEPVFTRSFQASGEVVLTEALELTRLYSIDTLLLAITKGGDFHFEVFNANSLKSLGKLIRIGRGPDEFEGPVRFCDYVLEENEYKFWFYDINTLEYFKINLNQSLRNGVPVVESSIYLGQKANLNKIFQLSSNLVIGSMTNRDVRMGRLRMFDTKKNEIVKTIDVFPEVEPKSQDVTYLFYRYNFLYVGNLVMKPDKTLFASALTKLNRIDIFDSEANLVNSIVEGDELPKSEIESYLTVDDIMKSDVKSYYVDAYATDEYIFGLYHDQPFRDYGKEISVRLRVFDWSGNAMAEVVIPDYIETFTIDRINWQLYGVKSSTDQAVLKYNLKGIIDEL